MLDGCLIVDSAESQLSSCILPIVPAFPPPSAFSRCLGGISGLLRLDRRRRFCMRLLPQSFGNLECVDVEILPPGHFIARLMQLSVMTTAKRHRELIADFHPDRPGLREPQVMRVGGLTPADKTGL
jgi:hypothetical protein